MNRFNERFFERTVASADGTPTVRLPVYVEDFDSPNSLTLKLIQHMLRSGKIEAFLAWTGFDLKTLFALAMKSIGDRQQRDSEEIADGWRQIEEIQERIRRAQDRVQLLQIQSDRLSKLRKLIR
jgi:hydrogenase maturation factor HypF (carbamoyltransferase family)